MNLSSRAVLCYRIPIKLNVEGIFKPFRTAPSYPAHHLLYCRAIMQPSPSQTGLSISRWGVHLRTQLQPEAPRSLWCKIAFKRYPLYCRVYSVRGSFEMHNYVKQVEKRQVHFSRVSCWLVVLARKANKRRLRLKSFSVNRVEPLAAVQTSQ